VTMEGGGWGRNDSKVQRSVAIHLTDSNRLQIFVLIFLLPTPLFLLFNTQTMHIQSIILNSTAM
jgi:hypothetical protein